MKKLLEMQIQFMRFVRSTSADREMRAAATAEMASLRRRLKALPASRRQNRKG